MVGYVWKNGRTVGVAGRTEGLSFLKKIWINGHKSLIFGLLL